MFELICFSGERLFECKVVVSGVDEFGGVGHFQSSLTSELSLTLGGVTWKS